MSPSKEVTSYAKKRALGLVPFRYSSEYHAWVEAIKSQHPTRIADANIEWQQMIKRRFSYGGQDNS